MAQQGGVPRRIAIAIVGAMLAHAAVIAIFAWVVAASRRDADVAGTSEAAARPEVPLSVPRGPTFAFTSVDVARLPRLALPLPLPGVGDAIGDGATIAPRAPLDEPGVRAADRGGGGGGPAAWTGRRDRADDALLRSEPWNGGPTYRSAHDDTAAPPRTTEAIHRAPEPDVGDRQRATAGAPGATTASRGDASGQGAGTAPPAALDSDPIFDATAGRTTPARVAGASRAEDRAAYADVGARAEDVTRHGAVGDDRAVAATSDQARPDPYDVTPASSGGTAEGVRGRGGAGPAADGGRTPGTAASTADAARGDGGLTVTAAPEDPYFRTFLRRLEGAVVFPKDLALDLRSGRVIASFRLDADGRIRDVRVDRPSAYPAFDHALVAALRQLGSLGPAPRRLFGQAAAIRVRVPFVFANPMIR